jgi:hypothetical protein
MLSLSWVTLTIISRSQKTGLLQSETKLNPKSFKTLDTANSSIMTSTDKVKRSK